MRNMDFHVKRGFTYFISLFKMRRTGSKTTYNAGVNMGRMMSCLLLMMAMGVGSCQQDGSDNASDVILYCSVDQGIAEPIVAAFEKQSGLSVKVRYDTEASKTVGLVQKIRAEKASPLADVFWSSEIFHTIRLANEGILTPYTSEQTRDWPARFADAQGRWYGFGLRVRVIGYNTGRVSKEDAPRCLEDVLHGRWKDRLVMAKPQFGTTGGDVASWFVHYGDEKAKDILRQLNDNNVMIVAGNSTAVKKVATGQADICFTDTDDIYAAQRNGLPVAMHFLDQNNQGALAIPNTAALIKNGPNPKNAKVLMAFLLSSSLEKMLVESDSHNSPIHKDLQAKYPEYALEKPLAVDYEQVAGKLTTAIESTRELLH